MIDLFAAAALLAAAAATQTPSAAQDAPQTAISDRAVNPSQPDFTLIGLPTALRIPRFKSAFRVTHRFTRSLGSGDLGDLAYDFFGFDSGAQIGLEYRFGIMAGTQIGIHRTSDRTIQFFGQHQLFRQNEEMPLGIDLIATVDGANNFRESYSPGIGAVISRELGRRGALYLHPIWIHITNVPSGDVVREKDTFMLGVGGRLRIRPSLYLVGEAAPRFGYTPNFTYISGAIEARAGGHSFQLNFGNGFGTTIAQIAKGGLTDSDAYIGFNISRKFF